MPEARSLPLFRWGEEIRREREARRQQRFKFRSALSAFAAAAVAALVASLVWKPRPLLVWNASASAPIGIYAVAPPRDLRPGDMAIAWTPEPARSLAAMRRYLPSNVPLLKRVAASAGDRVCGIGETVWINGRRAASRRRMDGRGRPLPSWTGCRDLGPNEFFLLMDHRGSFDGRYFGITSRAELVGRAVRLWAR